MYQIRILSPKGPDAFFTNELTDWLQHLFGTETTIEKSARDSRKQPDHTIVYLTVTNQTNQKGHKK